MTTKLKIRLLIAVLTVVSSTSLWAADARSFIEKGVRLHDDGDFQGAIAAFERALELEPENATARYELGNTYFTKGDYKACIKTAKTGIGLDSDLESKFYALSATCYSESGKPKKALELFRAGLEKSPDDTMLHFNIGVTLAGQGATDDAIGHFERTAEISPGYASPYLFIGRLHQDSGPPAAGLFYLTRFVTLEPNTARTAQASAGVFDLLLAGLEVKSDHEIELNVAISDDDDPFNDLEVSRSIAAASVHLPPTNEDGEEIEDTRTEAARQVDALVTFFQITSELAEDSPAQTTTAWKQAIAPILAIHTGGSGEALGYLMAARAGIPGGQEWLEQHPKELAALGEALNRSRP